MEMPSFHGEKHFKVVVIDSGTGPVWEMPTEEVFIQMRPGHDTDIRADQFADAFAESLKAKLPADLLRLIGERLGAPLAARKCQQCGGAFKESASPLARFCSAACKQKNFRAGGSAPALAATPEPIRPFTKKILDRASCKWLEIDYTWDGKECEVVVVVDGGSGSNTIDGRKGVELGGIVRCEPQHLLHTVMGLLRQVVQKRKFDTEHMRNWMLEVATGIVNTHFKGSKVHAKVTPFTCKQVEPALREPSRQDVRVDLIDNGWLRLGYSRAAGELLWRIDIHFSREAGGSPTTDFAVIAGPDLLTDIMRLLHSAFELRKFNSNEDGAAQSRAAALIVLQHFVNNPPAQLVEEDGGDQLRVAKRNLELVEARIAEHEALQGAKRDLETIESSVGKKKPSPKKPIGRNGETYGIKYDGKARLIYHYRDDDGKISIAWELHRNGEVIGEPMQPVDDEAAFLQAMITDVYHRNRTADGDRPNVSFFRAILKTEGPARDLCAGHVQRSLEHIFEYHPEWDLRDDKKSETESAPLREPSRFETAISPAVAIAPFSFRSTPTTGNKQFKGTTSQILDHMKNQEQTVAVIASKFKEGGHISFQTVRSTINILHMKGVLGRRRFSDSEGNEWSYAAVDWYRENGLDFETYEDARKKTVTQPVTQEKTK